MHINGAQYNSNQRIVMHLAAYDQHMDSNLWKGTKFKHNKNSHRRIKSMEDISESDGQDAREGGQTTSLKIYNLGSARNSVPKNKKFKSMKEYFPHALP